ncbi:putative DNA-damage inducible protein DDI1-like protein [Trypanosoma rangeli]|uniref:Putative DNA-damage inducible protein DDI1-like protein n=1 Tax=Trypanosoma rangeli TaxID=5698 RepID=A0A3R7ME57_TRYRA|nr:putative DNA-damage inducible protein DDI1-like protein [Trypanosoma rangeli]RNF00885.1 putative DNA-damage inducible protein DDI1-like protein [Trypanosoma rangeli]|eukprot:RNF00885.1 putative DNA-damage inducible protein DDI1-like protein [Trypanosoma rangeli]
MFVPPEMKVPPEGLQLLRCGLATVALPEPPLPSPLLAYWGLPFYSELPEEGQARMELMESYLLGLSRLLRLRNASLQEALEKALARVIEDEEVEREFIVEDGNLLAWRSFVDHTRLEALACLRKREQAARLRIIDTHFTFALRALCHFETLHRKHVATQFLDSLFLKRCMLPPERKRQQDSPLLKKIPAEACRTAETSWAVALIEEENSSRKSLVEVFFADIRLAAEVFAAVMKRNMYVMQKPRLELTASSTLNQQATVIQSVFRGHRERKRRCDSAASAFV